MLTEEAQAYIDGIDPARRPLFDRVHRLVLEAHPGVDVVLSYKMPTYVVGEQQLHIGVWKHGVSFYGWTPGRDAGFAARHPTCDSGKGTLRLATAYAAQVPDDELRALFAAALSPPA